MTTEVTGVETVQKNVRTPKLSYILCNLQNLGSASPAIIETEKEKARREYEDQSIE